MNAVRLTFGKTSKGLEALSKRDAAMAPKLRSMLILVNGKRTAQELGELSATPGSSEVLLAQLLELGLIERLTVQDEAPAAGVSASDLAAARKAAVRQLTDLLGPNADDLCIRLEKAKTANEFLIVLKRAEMTVTAPEFRMFCQNMEVQLR